MGSRLAPSAPSLTSSCSRRAENHTFQTPLQLRLQMCYRSTPGTCWQETWEIGSAHQAHVAFTFVALGSLGSMGLVSQQCWLKLPDLWLTTVTLGSSDHGRRQQLPLQHPGWTRAAVALAGQLWDLLLLPSQQFRNSLIPCVKSLPFPISCNWTTKC